MMPFFWFPKGLLLILFDFIGVWKCVGGALHCSIWEMGVTEQIQIAIYRLDSRNMYLFFHNIFYCL